MIILFDNLMEAGTLSAVNADENYPVSNLISPFLRQIYQSTGNTDTITLELTEDANVDALFWGFTNVNTMIVSFFDSTDTLIELIYLEGEKVGHYYGYGESYFYGYDDEYYGYYDRESDHYYDPASWHWDVPIENVRKITIEATTDDTYLYIGGIGVGKSYKMPDPDQGFSEGWLDNSIISRSQAGQSLAEYVTPLRQYGYSFSTVERSLMNELQQKYKEQGIGAHLWLDSTEKNHDFIAPMYGILEEWSESNKDGKRYNFDITLTEAR